MSVNILKRWELSDREFTAIVDENPSLRGFVFGYVSEYKVRKFFQNNPNITDLKKYDDHNRACKGDISLKYYGREFKIEAKSLQTNSVSQDENGCWVGKFQCDASDKRLTKLPNGHTVNTTCLAVGEFDIVAISLFAFGNRWRFAFAKNADLPHPGAKSRYISAEDRQYLIKSLIDITWPLKPPFTTDVYALMDEML